MKLKTAFYFALMTAAVAPIAACSSADSAEDEGVTDESEDALTSTARAFVGEYRWERSNAYLDFERLDLKDSKKSWGTYEAQVDTSITGVKIFCFVAPCTSLETGAWRVTRSARGALTLKVRPTGRSERAYGIVRQGDGSLRITRNGQSGVLSVAEDPCNLVDCASGSHCVSSGGSATCEVNPGGCATVLCAAGTQCVEGANGAVSCDPVQPPGCAAMLCAAGTTCIETNGVGKCTPVNTAPCVKTGCSGQICADQQRISTCEFRPEYACYQQGICERSSAGQCGFRQTPALATCLANAGNTP